MVLRFSVHNDDYDETVDRLVDLGIKFKMSTPVIEKDCSIIDLYISTYKEFAMAFYVMVMFAMLRDE